MHATWATNRVSSRILARRSSFFFSSRRRHTRFDCDWSSDVCSSDLAEAGQGHWADVQATLDRYARALPHNPRVQEARTLIAAARGDYALAERQAQALQQEQRTSPVWRASTSTHLFSLDELRGRLRQAEQDARDFQV